MNATKYALKHVDNTTESKWGFHPCSHEVYLKLKKLKKLYWETARAYAAWCRWDRKQPQNRFGPAPKYNKLFVMEGCKPQAGPKDFRITIPDCLDDQGILAAFDHARMPVEKDSVRPLCLSEQKIDQLLEEAGL